MHHVLTFLCYYSFVLPWYICDNQAVSIHYDQLASISYISWSAACSVVSDTSQPYGWRFP